MVFCHKPGLPTPRRELPYSMPAPSPFGSLQGKQRTTRDPRRRRASRRWQDLVLMRFHGCFNTVRREQRQGPIWLRKLNFPGVEIPAKRSHHNFYQFALSERHHRQCEQQPTSSLYLMSWNCSFPTCCVGMFATAHILHQQPVPFLFA